MNFVLLEQQVAIVAVGRKLGDKGAISLISALIGVDSSEASRIWDGFDGIMTYLSIMSKKEKS